MSPVRGRSPQKLGLRRHPDLVIAAIHISPLRERSVQSGRDHLAYDARFVGSQTREGGRGESFGTRSPIHHPLAETKFYTESTAAYFERSELPVSCLHPDFQRTRAGNCVIHVFRPKSRGDKRSRDTGRPGRATKKEKRKKVSKKKKKKKKKSKRREEAKKGRRKVRD